ncbi:hypothetical protein AB0C52_36070 [Streptomyces sp. NPDC048717]|uniref:hypothetical protein n=1 Tax=Streptomyces sp. NPDC048717 TaxID=3154928 RepID=UPI003442F6BC
MLQHLITHDETLRMVPTDRERLTTAVAELRESLRAALPAGTDPARIRGLARWTGIGLMVLGEPHGAQTFLRQALALATAEGNGQAAIAAELNLADAHRYSGQAETAETHYRSALATARSRHPELLDFALQHLAKHLIEQGDLAQARTHLEEALQLRLATGNAELIDSTQAALAHVDLPLG